MVQKLIAMLFPNRCVLCHRFLKEPKLTICPECLRNAPYFPFDPETAGQKGKIRDRFLDSIAAVWYYEGDIRGSIHRYKFRRVRGYGEVYAGQMAQRIPEGIDAIVWVPVSAQRKKQRGFDQSQLLAQSIGAQREIPVLHALKKTRNTPAQSSFREESARRANVMGAFSLQDGADVAGKKLLLVDDVYTTGATSGECARILLTAGAKEIHCVTVAAVRRGRKKR